MTITYKQAKAEDVAPVFELCGQLILDYEQLETIDLSAVMNWVRRKIETSIGEYTVILADGQKAGYYHFFKNDEGICELDDLYILPQFQNRGLGSGVIQKCLASVSTPVMLYVFIKNERAVALYQRLGFEISKTLGPSRYIMRHENRKYYAAYEERYKTAHQKGVSWASDNPSPIVLNILQKYHIQSHQALLEIGCGEGRDARALLDRGYHLLATDISPEAISYCRGILPQYADRFRVLDCLSDSPGQSFDFIYAVAVIHMLVPDKDRDGFYQFIRRHLKPEGLALICTMGDGTFEMQSDIRRAFELQEREHESGKMLVAGTTCRMVSLKPSAKNWHATAWKQSKPASPLPCPNSTA